MITENNSAKSAKDRLHILQRNGMGKPRTSGQCYSVLRAEGFTDHAACLAVYNSKPGNAFKPKEDNTHV